MHANKISMTTCTRISFCKYL